MAKSRAKKASGSAEATAEAAEPAAEEAEHRPTRERYLVSYPTRTPAPKSPTIEQVTQRRFFGGVFS